MERATAERLEQQDFGIYLPLWVDLRRQTDGWRRLQCPMFPRYLFVKPLSNTQSLAPIRSTRGVSQMVRFGMEPAWVSDSLIEEIQVLEAARNAKAGELRPFEKGDLVIVTEGPFKGIRAEVLSCGQNRVLLLFEILGKLQRLEFHSNACRAE